MQNKISNLSSIIDFSNTINKTLDYKFILDNLLLTCLARFKTSKGIVVLLEEQNNLKIVSYKGIRKSDIDKIRENIDNSVILDILIKNFNLFLQINLKYDEKIIGYILLGKKITNESYTKEEQEHLEILGNIAAIALTNAKHLQQVNDINNELKVKVKQLSTLFEIGQEFNLTQYDKQKVYKLLIYTLLGQFLISKYCLIEFVKEELNILENKFDGALTKSLEYEKLLKIDSILNKNQIKNYYPGIYEYNVQLAVPIQSKSNIHGILLLGAKSNNYDYTQSDLEFIASLVGLASLTIDNIKLFEQVLEKKKLEKELEIASQIQKYFLPSKNLQIPKVEYHGLNIQSRQVGGDFYDVIQLDENRYAFCIADVSGKSISAALIMANFQAFLKTLSKLKINNIVETTELLNTLVSENIKDFKYITFLWGILDINNLCFEYVNAGHNPGLLIRDNDVIKLEKGGIMLGMKMLNVPYQKDVITLKKNDIIVFYTDGVTEAANKDKEYFEEYNLINILRNNKNKSVKEINENILKSVKEFVGDEEQADDITLLTFKIIN
ncbi:MAG TPA: SpoIIE family protein phosphatase [Ignavibacteriales bacterium]|nr:SpoIIE family protein phosphatase [Ignavibacteriales bacterium]HPD66768.1 SpoIIE family protein phosphatase [Ignavibacteriales bacterium]HRR18153.1 SpoIIE family protein phosphatase [Ignavibacteriales bacterium]